MSELQRLVQIVDQLRDPGGCPWDREQTLASMRPYLLEECYELLEAMENPEPAPMKEELGDLLFVLLLLVVAPTPVGVVRRGLEPGCQSDICECTCVCASGDKTRGPLGVRARRAETRTMGAGLGKELTLAPLEYTHRRHAKGAARP